MDFSLLANLPEHVHPMAHAKERDAEDHSIRAIENIMIASYTPKTIHLEALFTSKTLERNNSN